MLPLANRVRKQREFDCIFKASKRLRSTNFTFLVHFRNNINQTKLGSDAKFGFVVSKKIGNAVVRNTVKRRLREIIRAELPKIKKGIDCVIITYPQIANQSFQELKVEVMKVLEGLRL